MLSARAGTQRAVGGSQRTESATPRLAASTVARGRFIKNSVNAPPATVGVRPAIARASAPSAAQVGTMPAADDLLGTSSVEFRISQRLSFGEFFKVVGNCDALGNWDLGAGVKLTWTNGDVWVGTAALPIGNSEFKYVIEKAGDPSKTFWEQGLNRRVSVLEAGTRIVVEAGQHNNTTATVTTVATADAQGGMPFIGNDDIDMDSPRGSLVAGRAAGPGGAIAARRDPLEAQLRVQAMQAAEQKLELMDQIENLTQEREAAKVSAAKHPPPHCRLQGHALRLPPSLNYSFSNAL